MDNRLQDILEKYDATLSQSCFRVQDRTFEVELECEKLLAPKAVRAIEETVSSLVPATVQLHLQINYANISQEIIYDFLKFESIMREILCDEYPECAPIIDISVWELTDDESVLIHIPTKFGRFLTTPVATMCRKLGIDVPFRVVADDEINVEALKTSKPATTRKNKPAENTPAKKTDKPESKYTTVYGKPIPAKTAITPMSAINKEMKTVTVRGMLVKKTEQEKKDQNTERFKRVISDMDSAVTILMFTKNDEKRAIFDIIAAAEKAGLELVVRGKAYFDKYSNEYTIQPYDIATTKSEQREDKSELKRVELHLHTQMSEMDGLTKTSEAVKTAARWGHKAIAITDHGVTHAFPEGMGAAAKAGIKLLYGTEGYLYDDCALVEMEAAKTMRFVAVAATTFNVLSETLFFEIAAYDITTGEYFHSLINPGVPKPANIQYAFTDEDIINAPSMTEVLKEFTEFVSGATVVTHNAKDYLALCSAAKRHALKHDTRHIDTSLLTHYLYSDADISTVNASYAFVCNGNSDDVTEVGAKESAKITASLFELLKSKLDESKSELPLMHGKAQKGKRLAYYHIILLAKNRTGLKNMYRMVSYSHCECLHNRPLMPRSLFVVRKEGIILGSACERGELFRAIVENKDEETIKKIASWYDYLEIQPIGNNAFMLRNGTVQSEDELRDLNRRIVELGEELNKPVCATGDVHFLNPADSTFRKIIMHAQHFKDAEIQAPLYFKTTDEMLEEFSYLGTEKAVEVVVTNTNKIADMCEPLTAYLNEEATYAPVFDGADVELRDMAEKRVYELYGKELPPIVLDRLNFELNSIINNGYATLYLMAQRLVRKSMSDGYLVGSRGSVGSSFVAFLAGITEVNPLIAHYLCPKCTHSDFDNPDYSCGADMPDMNCPECGEKYVKMGFDIPFEVFLGFKGDKTPDIDLNFSGEYQSVAHDFTREMFGEKHAYRAGSISTLKDSMTYGYVRAYCRDMGYEYSAAKMTWLAMGCVGVKKTTGQHAGGIVIVPEGFDVEDFMPLQYPANKIEGNRFITHFDFHSLNDKLVKLDILGHDDPTVLRMLQDITGLDPQDIPLDDPDTRELFYSSAPLKIDLSEVNCDVGVLGIPEYGTSFVRKILTETRPKTIEELVRISGLSHGTNVWSGNAQTLISSGRATLSQAICTRDDIMLFLISVGGEPSMSFKIMESVRKGKGLTPEMESFMQALPLPSWYIDSCKKIEYMFPRAHAAAYLTMAFRVAYYKMHYPKEFYAVYFTVRADDFDITRCAGGEDEVLRNLRIIERDIKERAPKENDSGSDDAPITTTKKMKKLIPILEIVYEMNLRGIKLLNIDINRSKATTFVVTDEGILPPFNAIPGLGNSQAMQIENAQSNGKEFTSVEDFRARTKMGTTMLDKFSKLGCLDKLCSSEQMNMIDLL